MHAMKIGTLKIGTIPRYTVQETSEYRPKDINSIDIPSKIGLLS